MWNTCVHWRLITVSWLQNSSKQIEHSSLPDPIAASCSKYCGVTLWYQNRKTNFLCTYVPNPPTTTAPPQTMIGIKKRENINHHTPKQNNEINDARINNKENNLYQRNPPVQTNKKL